MSNRESYFESVIYRDDSTVSGKVGQEKGVIRKKVSTAHCSRSCSRSFDKDTDLCYTSAPGLLAGSIIIGITLEKSRFG
jgi:hypothetical protein